MAYENTTMIGVDSSNISSIGYDELDGVLYISFKNGSVYWYAGVEKSLFDEFLMADSKGKFMWANIRGLYEYGRLI